MDVPGDAEQIPRVDTAGQRADRALTGEDRDRIDDRLSWITGDRVADVAPGIEHAELRESLVEERADDRIEARPASGPRTLACACVRAAPRVRPRAARA